MSLLQWPVRPAPTPSWSLLPSGSCHCGFALLLGQPGVVTSREDSAQAASCATPAWLPTHPSVPISSPTGTQMRPQVTCLVLTSQGHRGGGRQPDPPPPKAGSETEPSSGPPAWTWEAGPYSLLPGFPDPADVDRNLHLRQGLEGRKVTGRN